MWTSKILNKQIENGLLTLTVELTDGTTTVTDTISTRSGQPADWLNRMLYSRIEELTGLVAFEATIQTGMFTTTVPPVVEEEPATMTQYEKKLRKFGQYVEAIRKGIITDTNVDFLACKQWLTDNFSADKVKYF